jgi:hypothetical protein
MSEATVRAQAKNLALRNSVVQLGAPLAAKQTRLALQGGLADCVDFLTVLLRRVRTLRGHADRPGLDRRDISMHIGVGFLATEATYD